MVPMTGHSFGGATNNDGVRLLDSVGTARGDSGGTTIDQFDEDEGVRVAHLVDHLRALGPVVDQQTLG